MPDQIAAPVAPVAPTQPNGAAPVKTETAAEAKYRLKVDGEEREYSRAEVEKFAGKGAYADKAIKAAKERAEALAKKEAEIAEREKLWDDDEALEKELEKRGKLEKLARKKLDAKVEESTKTPDQLRAEKAEREAKELRDEKAKRDDEAKAAKQAEANKVIAQQMQSQLVAAAEAAGFEKSPDAFYALWEVVKEFKTHKLPWDAERVVEIAQANIEAAQKALQQSVAKSRKGAKLKDWLGPDVWKEVLRHALEEARGRGGQPPPKIPGTRPVVEPTKGETESPQDFLARQRGLK